jgi:hypothetical protein
MLLDYGGAHKYFKTYYNIHLMANYLMCITSQQSIDA